jgi:hypothetical protein
MKELDYLRSRSVNGIALALLGLSTGALAAGPDPVQFADYHPAHTVIKCPYIPPGMTEIPTCNGLQATCVGTDGDDLILGSEEDDVIVALAGDDVVHGDAGDDTICGGPGNDSLFGATGNDTLLGEEGDDWLFGARGDDDLRGGPGYDVLWGGPGHDKLSGGEGDRDVCMLQRHMGDADDSCNTIYPPPGYVHDDEPEPGLLMPAKPSEPE